MEEVTETDTLKEADRVKIHQGYHESEVTFGGEADLHKHYTRCKKNPGHLKFIPVQDFKKEHLPSGYCDDLVLDYIKAEADLTCRLTVKYISESRPEFDPVHPQLPYSFCQDRGSYWIQRVGTGCVFNVVQHKNKPGVTCNCEECLQPGNQTPRKIFAEVSIHTARHVVFDRDEARHTTCHFFYDSASTKVNQCPSLTGSTVREVKGETEEDWGQMSFVTHDMDLADKLEKMYHRRNSLRDKVNKKYKSNANLLSLRCVPESAPKPAVIISHPHGMSKQVSVGVWTERKILSQEPIHTFGTGFDLVYTSYRYNAATCPGSSGAPVITLTDSEWWWYRHAHSEGDTDNDNSSGFGMELLETSSG